MAAKIVVVPDAQWPLVEYYLRRLGEGGLILPMRVAKAFERQAGRRLPRRMITHTFDPPDVMVEVVRTVDHYAMDSVRDHLGLPRRGEEE